MEGLRRKVQALRGCTVEQKGLFLQQAEYLLSTLPEIHRAALGEELAHYVLPVHVNAPAGPDLMSCQEPHFMTQELSAAGSAGNQGEALTGLLSPEALLGTTATSALRCGSCGSSDVAQRSEQVRAGDEAQSWFYQCRACRSTWKMS